MKALMFQGTGSDVGKTALVAGLCRLFANRGLKVRPFKPQNMSNNAAVTADGGEIGRGQALQAFAARIAPSRYMNPVLLKPQSETGAQIIVNGQLFGTAKGRDYQALKPQLLDAVMQSYETLRADADLVLIEGAGSPAEINLRQGDIANMGFAEAANINVALIGDIDRGGVIASLVGTHTILPPHDRNRIKAFLINKFRGDLSLFDDGLRQISHFTNWPCLGVVPWIKEIGLLPAEDSMVLEQLKYQQSQNNVQGEDRPRKRIRIVVPRLPSIANFDDLDPLLHHDAVELIFLQPGQNWPEHVDLVVLAGSKATMSDLDALRHYGWEAPIKAHAAQNKMVIGICGGYQMLGTMIHDPDHIESGHQSVEGLGLLNVETVLKPHKQLTLVKGTAPLFKAAVEGYEIHMGQTEGQDCQIRPFITLENGHYDGAVSENECIMGTYLHGVFNHGAFRQALLRRLGLETDAQDHYSRVDQALDEIAHQLEQRLDIDTMLDLAR